MTVDRDAGPSTTRVLAALVLFGLAFGYVEGAVVVGLRASYERLHATLLPNLPPGELFPLIPPEVVRAHDPEQARTLPMELVREVATIVMLAAVPWTFSRNVREWVAGFMIGFGVWDLAYYAALRAWLGWPESLLTWDILFLVPLPWSGPVLAPMLVSASIIAAGVILLRREAAGRPVPLRPPHWTLIVSSGLIVILSFCWEGRSVAAGAMPGPFPWAIFAIGELLGLATFAHACLVRSA